MLDRLILSITKDSEAICWGKLSYLNSQRIERKINLKAYQHVAGYDEYLADVEWIVKQYKKTIGLGPKVSCCTSDKQSDLCHTDIIPNIWPISGVLRCCYNSKYTHILFLPW